MVRRVDSNLVWCRKCSDHAKCRLGPKLMNRCRPEEKDAIESENMKIISELEERRVPDRNARGWKIEGGNKDESPGKSARG